MSQSAEKKSNWQAYLELHLALMGDKTRLIPKKRYGPLAVQRAFYPEKDLCHLYLLHPPGGIVGGDQLRLEVLAKPDSHSLITAPGANKFYRSAGQTATYEQNINIEESSSLEFLPLENIYFPGALVNSHTNINVGKKSQFIYWETHCFGRPSVNEKFDSGKVTSSTNLHNEDGLLYTDKQHITAKEINRCTVMRGSSVISSMLVYGYDFKRDEIDDIRDVEVESGYLAVTQFTKNLLIIRYLGESTTEAQLAFREIWHLVRPAVIKRKACPPRIWNT